MKKGKQPHLFQKPVHPTLRNLVFVVGAFVAIVAALAVIQYKSASSQAYPTPTFAPVPTSQAVKNGTTPTPFFQTFTSSDLGISFSYPSSADVKEAGNKVYFSSEPDGLYVQVLSKDPADTLEAAARKQFLQGYSDQKCLFRDNSRNTPHLPSTFIRLSVYPADSNQEQDGVEKTDCPAYLIGQDGGSYFLMDPSRPNKFLFFHIIQGNYISDKGSWDESLHFLN